MKSSPNLLLQQLMTENEEGCTESRSEEQNEVCSELVAVVNTEWQIL